MVENMFHGAEKIIFEFAKANRVNPTEAEDKLWQVLKGKKLGGNKFRRQHPLGQYILDFYCHNQKIAIEIDGEYHNDATQIELDYFRTERIENIDISILRFSNFQVMHKLEFVLEQIKTRLVT